MSNSKEDKILLNPSTWTPSN